MTTFVPQLSAPPASAGPACWFIFQGDRLLVRANGDRAAVPIVGSPVELGVSPLRSLYLGYLEDDAARTDCFAAEIDRGDALPDGMAAEGLRNLYPALDEAPMRVAGRAVQLLAFERTTRYCGQCGGPMVNQAYERARRCPACELVTYPRLSPAIIIAVTRSTPDGLQILLARNHRFPAGRYSVLAGYVEPGESLEECAAREVCEEVGITIGNIRYFGSQPWPFPDSLMIGFTADCVRGEIRLEESELAEAHWFRADELPNIPPSHTIARQLIDGFVARAQATG